MLHCGWLRQKVSHRLETLLSLAVIWLPPTDDVRGYLAKGQDWACGSQVWSKKPVKVNFISQECYVGDLHSWRGTRSPHLVWQKTIIYKEIMWHGNNIMCAFQASAFFVFKIIWYYDVLLHFAWKEGLTEDRMTFLCRFTVKKISFSSFCELKCHGSGHKNDWGKL